jgi:hypothetical protein
LTYRLCGQNSKHCTLLILNLSSIKAHIQFYGTFCGLSFKFYHHLAIHSPQHVLHYNYTTFDGNCLQQTCYL